MRIRQITGNFFKLVLVCACVYGIVKWQTNTTQDGAVIDFAKNACVGEIRGRYDVSNVRAYEVDENDNGYVVRVSATTARGTPAKVICVTNAHGGVKEITLDER